MNARDPNNETIIAEAAREVISRATLDDDVDVKMKERERERKKDKDNDGCHYVPQLGLIRGII